MLVGQPVAAAEQFVAKAAGRVGRLVGAARITADPAYGKIVCFCERVTAGEIRDAFDSVIPPCGLEGLRRRTRVMNGRCQGFYCGADVQNLLDCHGRTDTSTPPANVGASTLQESH